MNNRLSDSMQSMVPEPTDTTVLFQGAKRKRRNRRVATAAVAGVAVLALAVPVGMQVLAPKQPNWAEPTQSPTPTVTQTEEPSETPDAPGPSPSATVTTGNPSRSGGASATATTSKKPGRSAEAPKPAPHPDLPLPVACVDGHELVLPVDGAGVEPGAVRAWLCEEPWSYGSRSPLEPLVTDVDRIVEQWNALPDYNDVQCDTGERPPVVVVVLEYADGSKRPIKMDPMGCDPAVDGAQRKGDGDQFTETLKDMWDAQRDAHADLRLPAPSNLTCPIDGQNLLVPNTRDAVTAFACSDQRDGDYRQADISDDLMRRIIADLENATFEEATGHEADHIVLATKWGDRLVLHKAYEKEGYWFSKSGDPREQGERLWVPSLELKAEVDALFQ